MGVLTVVPLHMFTVLLSPAVPGAPQIHSGVPQSHSKSPDPSRSHALYK